MNIKQNETGQERHKKALRTVKLWSETGLLRKTSFLYKLASKFFITLNEGNDVIINATSFANEIDSMITVLNRKYGNNWDFHLRPIYPEGKLKFDLSLKILFPEIEISNSRDEKHIIKDLIIIVTFKESDVIESFSICPQNVRGTRASFSYEEWLIGYNHSHLGTYKPQEFDNIFYSSRFCIGNGTEVENTMLYINENGYSEEQFELFLYNIDTMVSWESIEGVPYINMNNVAPITESTHQAVINPNINNLKSICNDISFSVEPQFKYVFNDNRFKIVQNNTFDEYIKMKIFNSAQSSYIKGYIIKEVGNIYFGFTNTEEGNEVIDYRNVNGELPFTMIHGRKIEFKREDFTGEQPNIDNYRTHPKLKEYVAKQLEQQLYYKAIRRSAITG